MFFVQITYTNLNSLRSAMKNLICTAQISSKTPVQFNNFNFDSDECILLKCEEQEKGKYRENIRGWGKYTQPIVLAIFKERKKSMRLFESSFQSLNYRGGDRRGITDM